MISTARSGLLALTCLITSLSSVTILTPAVYAQPVHQNLRLVILPFKNLTHAPADDWLGESFAESLTMGLLKFDALQLVERAQIGNVLKEQQFGQSGYVDETSAPQIGKLLGAQVVVLGSFQKVGDQLQANVRFVDVATGRIDGKHAAQVTGAFNQIFDLQKQLATDLLAQLEVPAKPAEMANLDQSFRPTDSPEAYKSYLNGIKALRSGDSSQLEIAQQDFQEALDQDPKFVLAMAGLAETHARKVSLLEKLMVTPPSMQIAVRGPSDASLARQFAEQAAALNPDLPEVMRAQAWVERSQGHGQAAEAWLEKAVRANPRDSASLRDYFSFRYENGNLNLDLANLRKEMSELGANFDDPWNLYTLGSLGFASESLKPQPAFGPLRDLLLQAQAGLPEVPTIPLLLYSWRLSKKTASMQKNIFSKR